MVVKLLLIIIAFGGGLTVGSAAAAFITILQIVPRLVQITKTSKQVKVYQFTITLSFVLFVIIYFSNFHMSLYKIIVILISLLYGIFIGLLSSALAEVLNVIPVLSKKLKIKDNLRYVIWALMGGKVAGSLYFWLFNK
ncbi:stage V sporulation protein AB [Tissierella carlieri]|jgi:stage V sporulation protein AB|uniref:stage V sporulation protein AB n=1 Tax=Tissierella TaxID=41273 RepID=UPI001C0FFC33|nr:stage V sporulation protein AB [Tissierella carlieri]MBU5313566.1 stage V sporulation protein AB [Tissierella carlieri]MDU5083068.1 stage V sporulation protein AB [Bacillota bacterium]